MIIRCQYHCEHNQQCTREAFHRDGDGHHYPVCLCPPGLGDPARPDWDHLFMAQAHLVALRGSCRRKQVGAVLVIGKRVIASGYNGAPHGMPTCIETGCQLVRFEDGAVSCVRTIHAEINSIIHCALHGVQTLSSTLYVTAAPCFACLNACSQAGVKEIVFSEPAHKHWTKGLDLEQVAKQHGIAWRQLEG